MKMTQVHLRKKEDDHIWCQLTFSLHDLSKSQRVLQLPSGFSNLLEPADSLASAYTIENWSSGIIGGAQYALRKTNLVFEKGIVLHELSGRLGAEDITGLALAATIAVMRLADQPTDALDLKGWFEKRGEYPAAGTD